MAHPERPERSEALSHLLEKAGMQGYLTTEDLMEIFPNAGEDREHLTVILRTLRRRGVDVFDHDTDYESSTDDFINAESGHESWASQIDHTDSDDMIGMYLKDMARVPLLQTEEEISIAKRIERGRKAKHELSKGQRRSNAERQTLEAQVQDGVAAREHLIKANTRLVVSIAKRYMGRGIHFLDLIQEGNLGLMKAVEKYDVHKGFRFSTYATWWIRQTISRSLADQSRTIRVPVHMSDRIRQVYKKTHELEQKYGRTPTSEELARSLHIPAAKIEWILKVSWIPLSLESPVNDNDEDEFGMFIEDEISPTPAQCAYQNILREKLDDILGTLTPREAHVLKLRFGLDDGETYTLEEVGQKFGLTRERIRQIEGKALKRLRHPKRSRQLKDYL